MAGVALRGWHRCVSREMASIAVSEFTIELPRIVAVETDSHRANEITSDWVKAVTDGPVTITARHIGQLAMSDPVVRRAEPILRKLLRQGGVACHAEMSVPLGWIDDHAEMRSLYVLCRFVAVVTRCAFDSAMGSLWCLRFDSQSGRLICTGPCLDQRFRFFVAGLAGPCPW